MSATTSLEPTSLGGWCSCSSQRCLIVILLQTRVQVVYLCSYLLMSKAPTLSFGVHFRCLSNFRMFHPQSLECAHPGSCDCPVGSVHAGPWRLWRGFSEHTSNMGQNPEKLVCEQWTSHKKSPLIYDTPAVSFSLKCQHWILDDFFLEDAKCQFSKVFSQTIIRVCTESGNPKVVCFRAQVFWMLLLFTLLGWSKFIIRTSSLGKLPVECTNRAERGLQKTLGVKNLDPKKHIVWKIGQSVGFKYVHHFLRTSCWWNHPSCWWIHPSSGTRGLWLRRRGLDWCNIDHGLKKLLGMFGRNTGKSMGLVCGLCVVSLMMVSCTWPWKKMESYEVMIIFRSQMPMT